jgi:hypothetical protein
VIPQYHEGNFMLMTDKRQGAFTAVAVRK